ncbi:MAG: hypothetical protein ACP5IT_11870 [Thermoproteota archaeon]
MKRDIGTTFISIYLAVTGAIALIVSFMYVLYTKNIIPTPIVSVTLPLMLVLLFYGLAEIASAYMLEKKMFEGWFLAVILLSIQGLVSAFTFSIIPTIIVVAMLVYLVMKKEDFGALAPVKAESTQAPKVPEMKFVIFDPEEKKFVRRKR